MTTDEALPTPSKGSVVRVGGRRLPWGESRSTDPAAATATMQQPCRAREWRPRLLAGSGDPTVEVFSRRG
jgi:hypothetical protein